MCLLDQVKHYKDNLEFREKKCDEILLQNLSQEIDLSMVLNQQSYLEERLPDFMRFENENALNAKQTLSVYENEQNILKTQHEQMVLPENNKT